MASRIPIRKATTSQYLAYKSEPVGALGLGDSASFRERTDFSLQSTKFEAEDFDVDFSHDPSWLKKTSPSSVLIPSKGPDTSENWLMGTNKSVSSSSLNVEKSEGSNYLRDPSIRKPDADISNVMEPSLNTRRSEVSSIHNVNSIQQLTSRSDGMPEFGETSELPSLYWKPSDNKSQMDLGKSELVVGEDSYVAGHFDSLSFIRREVAASSLSRASDFFISEPQLSSTITPKTSERRHKREMSSASSGIGASGFETPESRRAFNPPPTAKVTPQNPAGAKLQPTSNMNTDPAKYSRQTPAGKLPNTTSKPAGKARSNLLEQQQSPQVPLVKCNKSQVYFGGCKLRQMQKQKVIVRNSSLKQGLELELRIKDSDAFYLVEADRSLVSCRHVHLEPRQECCIYLVFQPKEFGPKITKLNLCPRATQIKYSVDLYGYGGSSLIHHAGPDNILVPKSKGAHWNCQLVLENRGNIPGFACIQPVQEDGSSMDPLQCIVMPQLCLVNAGDFQDIQVLIFPPKDVKFGSFKLQVVWGDEPLRNRWIKCIVNGTPFQPPVQYGGIDFTKLLQPICNDNPVVAISEEDLALFYKHLKVDELDVIFPDDSRFLTLDAEPDSFFETSTDTMMSQRRMTSIVSSTKPPSEMSAGVQAKLPSTKALRPPLKDLNQRAHIWKQ